VRVPSRPGQARSGARPSRDEETLARVRGVSGRPLVFGPLSGEAGGLNRWLSWTERWYFGHDARPDIEQGSGAGRSNK
jgi:hypothetical protein